MVIEEEPEEDKYPKVQNTNNSSTEGFVSIMPEPLEKMVKESQNHPSLSDFVRAVNYILSQ